MKDRMTKEQIEIILAAVDRAVQTTGYPVTQSVLKAVNVTRTQARQLERKGYLNRMDVGVKGQLIVGYFAHIVPKAYEKQMKREAEREEARLKKAQLLLEQMGKEEKQGASEEHIEALKAELREHKPVE